MSPAPPTRVAWPRENPVYLSPTVLLTAGLILTVCVLAGLINTVLHLAEGAAWPTAARAGGRASIAVAAVLLAAVGVVVGAGL